jgi:exonuclease SbcC
LRLEVTGFGPYLDPQTVDFAVLGDHGLFLIHGATGSGKSSVLDAICFALFGATSGGERDGTDFVSTLKQAAIPDPQDWPRTRVVFEFEHLGARYRVTRFPTQERAKKRGEGTLTEQTEGSLENLDTGKVLAAKATDVTAAVQEMLRCDLDQFRQTVVLPQGAFRKVVTDHKARRSILATIFQTRRFARLAERLKVLSAELVRAIEAKEGQRTELLRSAGAENAEALEVLVERAAADEAAVRTRKDAADAARTQVHEAMMEGQRLADDFDQADRLRTKRQQLDERTEEAAAWREQAARAQRAARLAGDREHLDARLQEAAALAEQVRTAREALEQAESELRAADEGQAQLDARRGELEAAERQYQDLRALQPQVTRVAERRAERGALEEAARAAEQAVDAASERVRLGETRLQLAAEERKALRPRAAREPRVREAVARREADLVALERIETLRAELAGVEDAVRGLETGEDPLARLTEAVRRHAPGLLADGLTNEAPCPVCGSVHHPSPAAADGGVEALEQAFHTFGEAAAEAEGQRQQARSLRDAMHETAVERSWGEAIPEPTTLHAALREASEDLASCQEASQALAALDDELDALNVGLPEQRAALDATKREAEQARGRLGAIDAAVEAVLQGLPEEHRDPEAFAQALADAEAAHRTLKEQFDVAAERTSAAREGRNAASTHLNTLEGQAKTADEALERLRETFAAKLQREGFGDRAGLEAATLEQDELDALVKGVAAYDEEVASVRRSLADLDARLEGKSRPDMAALAAAHDQAKAAYQEAEGAWTAAWQRSSGLAEAWSRFRDIERAQAKLRERATAAKRLSDTANGQLKGRARVDFETFVLQSIFYQVLQTANHHLHHMTGGRYSLHLRMDESASSRGLELDVSDHASGGEMREVRTLSGGEGFMASLALALALSEIAQQQSGGSELGALFVDEGFGSLDQRTLAQVVEILRGLQDDHRMVGVISHVDDLKRSIPVQLLVEPAERGSRIRMSLNA